MVSYEQAGKVRDRLMRKLGADPTFAGAAISEDEGGTFTVDLNFFVDPPEDIPPFVEDVVVKTSKVERARALSPRRRRGT